MGPGPSLGGPPAPTLHPVVFTLASLKPTVTKNCPRGIVGWQGLYPNIQNPKFQIHEELPIVTHSLHHY